MNDYPIEYLIGLILALVIVYANQIPRGMRIAAESLVGKLLAIALAVTAAKAFGWVYGLLVVLAYLVLLGSIKGATGPEGFQAQIVKETIGRRWYVERVLGERPELIDTEKVTSTVVTDNSQRGMSSRI
jgi:phosphotransferase system  glucose/maltose/N-acetylglucosamine-specific IIC component